MPATGEVQVVCGAPNARAGMIGVFAPAGTVIPRTGAVLKESAIRGVASNGMLCSGYELGLSEDHDGIIELPHWTRRSAASYAACSASTIRCSTSRSPRTAPIASACAASPAISPRPGSAV